MARIAEPLGVGGQARCGGDVVNDLSFERIHRRQRNRLPVGQNGGYRFASDCCDLLAMRFSVIGDVEHEAATLAGLCLNGQTSELLERIKDLAPLTDEAFEPAVGDALRHDRDRRAVGFDANLNVSV